MNFTREGFLDRLLDSYTANYDIERTETDRLPLAATAQLHVTETQYILSKRAQMWRADSDEYVYFFSVPALSDELCQQCIQYAYDNGMGKIDLTSSTHHMCTRLVALFLCDSMEEAAVTRLEQCRLYKSFQFSLKGWMEFHTIAVDFGKESVVSNRYGRDTAKFLKKLLQPQKGGRGKNPWSIIQKVLH